VQAEQVHAVVGLSVGDDHGVEVLRGQVVCEGAHRAGSQIQNDGTIAGAEQVAALHVTGVAERRAGPHGHQGDHPAAPVRIVRRNIGRHGIPPGCPR